IEKSEKANIPSRFSGSELSGFLPGNNNDSLKNIKNIVKKFVDDYPTGQKGIMFQGETGVGKTRLLCSIATEIFKKNKNADIYYIDWNEMVREMKSGESHTFRDFTSINSLIQRLISAELLLIDELGASEPSQWVRDNIYFIINNRYNRQKMTLFATNYPDISNDGKPSLSERIGDRIRSRIYEMADTFIVKGIDYRQKWG
ncbi:MAG: ATP-binding protein, partial [Acidobacteriota bacterium]